MDLRSIPEPAYKKAVGQRSWQSLAPLYRPGRRTDAQRDAAAEAAVRYLRLHGTYGITGNRPVILWARSPEEAARLYRSEKLTTLARQDWQNARGDASSWAAEWRPEWHRWAGPLTDFDWPSWHFRWDRADDGTGFFVPINNIRMPGVVSRAIRGFPLFNVCSMHVVMLNLGMEIPDQFIVAQAAPFVIETSGKIILLEYPEEMHTTSDGIVRLHRGRGPAITWPDGNSSFHWAGTQVSEWLLTQPKLLQAIISRNVEDRREAMEAIGLSTLISDLGVTQVGDPQPDPGNPGQVIRLIEIPELVFGVTERAVIVSNGTPEPDGSRREYILFVPRATKTPLEGVARLAGLTPAQYATMERRT